MLINCIKSYENMFSYAFINTLGSLLNNPYVNNRRTKVAPQVNSKGKTKIDTDGL